MFVHYQKQFQNYNYFLSKLVGLKQKIAAVKATEMDGEKNLVDVVVHNFPEAAHVCHFRHLQQNIESHLNKQQFSSAAIVQYTRDITIWVEKFQWSAP